MGAEAEAFTNPVSDEAAALAERVLFVRSVDRRRRPIGPSQHRVAIGWLQRIAARKVGQQGKVAVGLAKRGALALGTRFVLEDAVFRTCPRRGGDRPTRQAQLRQAARRLGAGRLQVVFGQHPELRRLHGRDRGERVEQEARVPVEHLREGGHILSLDGQDRPSEVAAHLVEPGLAAQRFAHPNASAGSCSEPCNKTTTGTAELPGGSTGVPTARCRRSGKVPAANEGASCCYRPRAVKRRLRRNAVSHG